MALYTILFLITDIHILDKPKKKSFCEFKCIYVREVKTRS